MMRSAAFLAALLFAVSAAGQELILAEHGSVGIDPYTKLSYVTRYSSDLQFLRTELSYPLISGSPSAALAVGGVLYVGEGNCPDLGKVCAPRVARHDPSGEVHNIGPELRGTVKSIRLSPAGELVVTTTAELVRIDLQRGAVLADFPLTPLTAESSIVDGDVNPKDGCLAAITILPSTVLLAGICGDSLSIRKTIAFPGFEGVWGVRFTPDGDLLVSGRTLHRFDHDGNLVRTYDVEGGCRVEVTPGGTAALLACGLELLRLDLTSGVAGPPVRMQRGIWADSIAFVVPARRRVVAH